VLTVRDTYADSTELWVVAKAKSLPRDAALGEVVDTAQLVNDLRNERFERVSRSVDADDVFEHVLEQSPNELSPATQRTNGHSAANLSAMNLHCRVHVQKLGDGYLRLVPLCPSV
jgi:hypothetical protein